jgi:hypothetical protein
MPTIEERLAAVTQTLELIAGMQLRTEIELGKMARYVNALAKAHDKRLTKLEKGKK